MVMSRKSARLAGNILLIIGGILGFLFVIIWSVDGDGVGGMVCAAIVIVFAVYLRQYNPENTLAAKQKVALTRHQNFQAQMERSALKTWCPNQAVSMTKSHGYRITPDAKLADIEACSRYVSKRIVSRERELRPVEREAEKANLKANTDRMRRRASRTSFTRIGQDLRAQQSQAEANTAERKVAAIEKDIENLHRLNNQITDRIESLNVDELSAEILTANNSSSASYCTHCGNPVEPDEYYCRKCGKELVQNI